MHHDILKRLDIIKNAVAMEDEELITMQVIKLQALPLDTQVTRKMGCGTKPINRER